MKSVIYLVFAAVLVLFLGACTDKGLDPIFYTLERERSLIDDRGLEDDISIYSLVKAGGRYFAAANTLFSRTETGNWSRVSTPESGALCNTLGVYGGFLYAGFYNIDGDGLGLYRTAPGTINWVPLADPAVQDKQIGMIKTVGTVPVLYVSTAVITDSSNDFYLYSSGDGTTFTRIDFDGESSIDVAIKDIDLFPSPPAVNDEYWVIATDRLYADTDDGILNDLALQSGGSTPETSGSKGFGGLLHVTIDLTDYLYLSSRDGKLWRYDAVGGWGDPEEVEVDGDAVPFTRFVELAFTGHTDLFVGSIGKGYYELLGGSLESPVRRPSYNINELYANAAIHGFLADPAPPATDPTKLFAYTSGAGLWRADYVAGDWQWVQE